MTLPEDLRIRLMAAADLEAVLAIEQRSDSAPHWSDEEYLKLFESDSRTNFKRFGMVAEANSEVAGFAILRVLAVQQIAEAELESIVVGLNWRGRGVGFLLLSESVSEARKRGARELILEVRASNRAAIGLYEKAEFHETGRRPVYYRDPDEDAVLMSVTL